MNTSLRSLVLAGALALAAAPALAQRADAHRDKLAARLDTGTVAALAPILDAAQAQGLPVEPLVQKALEGASKRAPSDRIVLAVRRLSTQLGAARTALGPTATASEMVAGASALQAGVQPQVLAVLRDQRPQAALTVPLGVLAELIARGVPADTGAMAVAALVSLDVNDAQLVAMRRDVERDIGVGAPPTAALFTRASGLAPANTDIGRIGIELTGTTGRTAPRRRP